MNFSSTRIPTIPSTLSISSELGIHPVTGSLLCRSVNHVSSAQSGPRLGVDLGTLSMTAAVNVDMGGVQAPTIVLFGEAGVSSSAVAFTTDGFVVGAAAEQIIATNPDHGTHELKRRFGDKTPIVLDGHPYDAHTLCSELLRAVVDAARIDSAATALTLTHPANWREYKLELLADMATQVGFTDVELISEPAAAVRHCANTGLIAVGDTVAVYNFGATFDASIVTMTSDGPQVVGTPQDLERLGGTDFDQVVFNHVVETLGGAVQQLDRHDPAVHSAIVNLRAQCTAAKERLSTDSEATIAVVAPGLDTQVRITRDEFEVALRPHITETLNALDRALASTDLKPTDLRGIVLTGGTSRTPLAAEMIAGHLGRPVLDSGDPQRVVALGAAVGPTNVTRRTELPAPILIAAATTPSAISKETPMSDQPTSTPGATTDAIPAAPRATAAALDGDRGRSTPPPPAAPVKGGLSKAAKIAGGVAAAAAAVAGAVVFGDDIVDVVAGDDGDNVAQAAGMPTHQPQRNEREGDGGNDSMDAFDTTPSKAAGQATTASPVQGPLGTPLASQVAGPQDSAPSFATQSGSAPQQHVQQEPAQHQGQQQHVTSAPADAPMASASVVPNVAGGGAMPAPNADFEAARATLLARLDNFQAPAGTSPEDAAALKQDLQDAIARFEPAAGQSTQDALAAMHDDYDQHVHDFTQDQKIDALVREAQRDNAADGSDTSTATATAQVDPAVAGAVPPAPLVDDTATATQDAAVDMATPGHTDTTGGATTQEPTVDTVTTVTPGTEDLSGFTEVGVRDLGERINVTPIGTDADAGVATGKGDEQVGSDAGGAHGGQQEAERDEASGAGAGGGVATGKGDEQVGSDVGGAHGGQQVAELDDAPGTDNPSVAVGHSGHVLVDDFEGLTATAATGDLGQVDGSVPLQQTGITVTDVRASLPDSDGPRPTMIVEDVVGDSTYGDVVQTAAVLVDPGPLNIQVANAVATPDVAIATAPVVGFGADDANDGNVPVDIVITVVPFDAGATTVNPTDDDSDNFTAADDDFATDIAKDITPNSPTDMSFGP